MASFFSQKARLWTKGRAGLFEKLETEVRQKRKKNQNLVWIHCASLGEFEQGRPVIEKLKKERPDTFVCLTFFSPSGFEIRKNYPHADLIIYLPPDSRRNARRFLDILQPDLAIFVKYEFWFHFLDQLRNRDIPTFLIAAIFREGQPFFKPWGRLHRRMLGCFSEILVQEEKSADMLRKIGFSNIKVCGDPRVDRVLSISENRKELPSVEKFCGNHRVLVCGSTWQPDENCLKAIWENEEFSDWKFILAPHDISKKRLNEVEDTFSKSLIVRYSQLETGTNLSEERMLLIDNIGLLSSLYFYGKVAYVGGGFGSGIHNILEPMTFGLPVIFGPNFKKFREANQALDMGCGFSVQNENEIQKSLRHVIQEDTYEKARQSAFDLIHENKGATELVFEQIKEHLK